MSPATLKSATAEYIRARDALCAANEAANAAQQRFDYAAKDLLAAYRTYVRGEDGEDHSRAIRVGCVVVRVDFDRPPESCSHTSQRYAHFVLDVIETEVLEEAPADEPPGEVLGTTQGETPVGLS
jgi:hypothetical protein